MLVRELSSENHQFQEMMRPVLWLTKQRPYPMLMALKVRDGRIVAAGGQASTPQALRARTLAGASSPARSSALGREPGRRLRLAQERMQAAVQAAEADRSETYSGRSTEDTEVRSQSPLGSFLIWSDQYTCMAEEESSQACPRCVKLCGLDCISTCSASESKTL